jgi:hypothetical protein
MAVYGRRKAAAGGGDGGGGCMMRRLVLSAGEGRRRASPKLNKRLVSHGTVYQSPTVRDT